MKRFLSFVCLLLACVPALADYSYIPYSELKPVDGFVRKSPCQAGAGDNCGADATWAITPDQCGLVFSTSSARDEQYTYAGTSGNGVQTAFSIPFKYLDTSHLIVSVAGVTKTLGADYTVSAPGNSGTVTFTAAPALGASVSVSVKKTWNGDGVTTAFPFHFPIKYINQLVVQINPAPGVIAWSSGTTYALGAQVTSGNFVYTSLQNGNLNHAVTDGAWWSQTNKILNDYSTDYTITSGLGSSTGGTITFVVAPPTGTNNVSVAPPTTGTSRGNRFTLPTVASLRAAGYTSGGASPNSGRMNREGQCSVSFVVAAPTPANYLRIGLPADAVRGTDKLTNLNDGNAFDASSGDLVFPHGWGIIRLRFNGVSWLADGSASTQDRIGLGSPHAHGQGRLFQVTADPTWWTVGSKIGSLAWCPVGGRGIGVNANDHPSLLLTPVNCSYLDPSGSSTGYIQAKAVTNLSLSDVVAGAAYIAGQAPNGQWYPAGTYPKISLSGTDGGALVTGDTLTVWNAPMTLGSVVTGKWIVKVTSTTLKCDGVTAGACVELHEEVQDWDATISGKNGIGPPANFLPGDTLADAPGTNRPCCTTIALQEASTALGRITEPVNGIDLNAALQESVVVGLAKQIASVWTTSGAKQNVAGVYNPVERRCSFSPSADKNITSLTDVEVDATTNCEFAFLNGTSKVAMDRGDTGRRVRYQVSATVSSNTAANGCQLNITFDGGAGEEAAPPVFVNPAGVTGGKFNISFAGNKSGLSEGMHTVRLVAKAVTGGTCTIYKDNTVTSVWIMQ